MEKGEMDSYPSLGGDTAKVHLKDEDYLIVYREAEHGEGFRSVDIDFRNHLIRIYDDRPWKIHHMDRNSQTIEFPVLDHS